jgi:hypothetical protein
MAYRHLPFADLDASPWHLVITDTEVHSTAQYCHMPTNSLCILDALLCPTPDQSPVTKHTYPYNPCPTHMQLDGARHNEGNFIARPQQLLSVLQS